MLKTLVQEAHIVIRPTAITSEQEPHSTITAFLINPRGLPLAPRATSRIYHFQNGRMMHRTSDHSYVQALVDRGEITEAEANNHPHSNILVGCLGPRERPTHHHPHDSPVASGDVLLACSDGVWHYFSPTELGSVVDSLTPVKRPSS